MMARSLFKLTANVPRVCVGRLTKTKFDMEHEILDLIDRYWKFDDYQTPVSNWHDKQDLLEAVRKALRIHDVVGRSEQLAAFLKWYYENDECPDLVTYEAAAERFLSR